MFGIKKKIDEILSEYFTNYDKENSRIGKNFLQNKKIIFQKTRSFIRKSKLQ